MSLFNLRRGPSGPLDVVNFPTMPKSYDIWVSQQNGSDLNIGTVDSPVQSLDAALEIAGRFISDGAPVIHLLATRLGGNVVETVYESESIWDPRFIGSGLKIESPLEDVIPETGALEVTGISGGSFTVGGAPGWTPEQWIGWQAQVISTGAAGFVGTGASDRKFIAYNDDDTLTLSYPFEGYPGFSSISIGDTIRVMRSAVHIRASLLDSQTRAPGLVGGVMTSGTTNETDPPNRQSLTFRNVEIAWSGPVGVMFLSGSFNFEGCSFSGDGATNWFPVWENGTINAGTWVLEQYDPGEYIYGWGLGFRDRSGGGEEPSPWFGSVVMKAYLVGGKRAVFSDGGSSQLWSCSFKADTGSRAAVLLTNSPHFLSFTSSSASYAKEFRTTDENQADVAAFGAHNIVLTRISHRGPGSILRAHKARVNMLNNPTIQPGSSTPAIGTGFESNASEGATVRARTNIENIGDVSAGIDSKTTRVGAPWSVGDTLIGNMGEVWRRTQ